MYKFILSVVKRIVQKFNCWKKINMFFPNWKVFWWDLRLNVSHQVLRMKLVIVKICCVVFSVQYTLKEHVLPYIHRKIQVVQVWNKNITLFFNVTIYLLNESVCARILDYKVKFECSLNNSSQQVMNLCVCIFIYRRFHLMHVKITSGRCFAVTIYF